MKKHVVIIGGFRRTKLLATSLIKKGFRVTVINEEKEQCKELAEIEGVKVFIGDGSKPFVLEDANVYQADITIALTDRDEDNLVICQLCKKRFGVKRTVALISDPKKIEFFYLMGIDSVVCAVTAIVGIIEQHAFLDEVATMIPIGEGRIKIAQVPVSQNSPAVGKKLWEMNLPKDVIIGCIMRHDKNIIPRGDTRIVAGDLLLLISTAENENAAIQMLTGQAV